MAYTVYHFTKLFKKKVSKKQYLGKKKKSE